MISAAICLIAFTSLFGQSHYVDFAGGSDTNAGTSPDTAFKHCPGDVNATGNARKTQLKPGDVVRFKGGVTYRGSVSIRQSGTQAKPIVYDGNSMGDYGEGRAIIDGSVPIGESERCTDAAEAWGNPNFRNIYWAWVPKGARWDTVNLFQGDRGLSVSQDPNLPDPIFQEDPRYYVKTEPEIPRTLVTIKVRPLGGIGENRTRPLISMFDDSRASGVIHRINSGGEIEIEVPKAVTVTEFALTPQARYTNPKEVSFKADGQEVLKAQLKYNPDKSVEQRFKLEKPVSFRKLVVKFVSAYPLPNGKLNDWGAVQKLAAYDAAGKNMLYTERKSVLRNEKYFTQQEPHFFDNALLALYARPNAVYYKRILSYSPVEHQINFDALGHSQIPYDKGGAFSIVNSVRFIDRPGEYALVLDPEKDGRHKVFVWPLNGKPDGLTHGRYGTGIELRGASFIKIQGFLVRKQGWKNSTGIDGRGKATDLVIRDVKITGLRGHNSGIHTTQIDNVLVEDCEIVDNAGHTKGILLRNARNIVVRGCVLRKNSSTALDFYTVENGVVQDCLVTQNKGMHANGLTFYVGCKDILVERNIVKDGNVALTVQDGNNMIVRNNVFEGGRGSPAIGLWAGRPYNNIVITNNVLRYHGEKGSWAAAIYGGNPTATGYAIVNNIIDGISGNVLRKADLHHNIFTRYGPSLTEARLGNNKFEPDLGKIFSDPGKGYWLKPGSPASGAGIALTSINKHDMEGVQRDLHGSVDIGAFVFIEEGPEPGRKPIRCDPRTFKFSYDGYQIKPPPDLTSFYKMKFQKLEDGQTYTLKGIDFTGEGGGNARKNASLGSIFFWDNPDHWLEWTIKSAKPGFYELAIEHASQMPSMRQVLLNGEPVKGLEQVEFKATGAWRAFEKDGLEVALKLRAGKNVVRFVNVKGSLNFKRLEFIQVVSDKAK
ncbi:MAG: right-handed parallel beta-helix repeat-containing protein [Planctomycetota bacterium]|nr:right-handed parallel beta-helix repeat-containing protein [Planctomycetota bacterium]